MIGLNKQILVQYIEYITNARMSAIGFPVLFPEARSNPIPWINNWLSSDNVQVAPQESEITNYLVAQIDSDLSDTGFDDFEL
jgi:ribonucleoside-diphosphate reductase beta chain